MAFPLHPHGTYAKDLEYFVSYFGMSNAESLICATRNGGLAFEPDGSVGTLEEGSLADLVIVDGNPLEDITVLQDHQKLTVDEGRRAVPEPGERKPVPREGPQSRTAPC